MKRFSLLFSLVVVVAMLFAFAGAPEPGLASPASAASNEALVEQYFGEVLSMGNVSVAEEILAPDFRRIDRSLFGATTGVKGTEFLAGYYRNAFPDLRYTIDAVVVEGDLVAVCWTASGTRSSDFGWVQANGATVVWTGMSFVRVENGRIAEEMINLESLVDRFNAQEMRFSPNYVD
jgi:predicted ester cyclase